MKRWVRIIFITAAIFLGLSVLLAGSILYTTKYRVTVIDRQVSPDGRGEVTLRMKASRCGHLVRIMGILCFGMMGKSGRR